MTTNLRYCPGGSKFTTKSKIHLMHNRDTTLCGLKVEPILLLRFNQHFAYDLHISTEVTMEQLEEDFNETTRVCSRCYKKALEENNDSVS